MERGGINISGIKEKSIQRMSRGKAECESRIENSADDKGKKGKRNEWSRG